MTGNPANPNDDAITLWGTNVSIEGLNIAVDGEPRESSGVRCYSGTDQAPGRAAIFDAQVSGFISQPGVNVQRCALVIERSAIIGNGSGVMIRNGSFRIQHAIIAANAQAAMPRSGIEVTNDASDGHEQILEFSTIANNSGGGSSPNGLNCLGDARLNATGLIITGTQSGADGLINGGGVGTCQITHSNTYNGTPTTPLPGDGNLASDPRFENESRYELSSTSPGRDVSGLSLPTLTLDTYGTLRSTTAPDMGAVEQ